MGSSLPELRERPHLSVSQLKVFLQCPRKYRLQYIDRVEPAFRPVALVFGTAWHEAVGHHLLHSTAAEPVSRDEVRSVFGERLSIAIEGEDIPVLFDDDAADTASTMALGLSMLDVFLDRVPVPERVIGVELPFSLELASWLLDDEPPAGVSTGAGEVTMPPLIGAIDAIVEHQGQVEVWELKSGKKKWSVDQLEHDLQPTAYGLAAEQLGHEEPGLKLVLTTKTQRPDVQVADLVRNQSDRQDLLVTARSLCVGVAAGVDHPVRGWACRGCPVAHACD